MEDKYKDLEIDSVAAYARNIGEIPVHINIAWSSETIGFGNLGLIIADGKIVFDHEHMTKEFVISALTKLVEKYYK